MATRRKAPLTRDAIFSAALAIIDVDGLAGLSMRRLAQDLGIEAMSLYHHVADKRAVLAGVVELSLRTQAVEPPRLGAKWEDIAAWSVLGFRRTLVAHPNVLPIMAAHPPTSPESFSAYVGMPFRFFVAHGIAEKDAAKLIEALFALGFGHALLTTNYKEMRGENIPPIRFTESSFEETVRLLIRGYGKAESRRRSDRSGRSRT